MALIDERVHRLTVDDFLRLADPSDPRWEHTELIQGLIYDMSPEHLLHMETVKRLYDDLLVRLAAYRVFASGSVWVTATACPMPDVMVFRPGMTYADDGLADGAFLELVVEVAVTSLARDLGPKLEDYAEGGVPRYVVVVPAEKYLVVHQRPVDGRYELVETITFPDSDAIDVGALLATVGL